MLNILLEDGEGVGDGEGEEGLDKKKNSPIDKPFFKALPFCSS